VFAYARTTANDPPLSYRPPECGPAAPEIVGDDRRLVDRVREIAREQSRTTERPRVGIYPPKKIKDVAPVWPGQAQVPQNSATVTVILEVTINAAGVVSDARVLRSVPSFDQAAVEVSRRWEYLPALINGVAMPATTTEAVAFRRP
jgi:TonB family protein